MPIDLRIAWQSLTQHGRRSLLLAGVIAVVTMLSELTTGLAAGIREEMLHKGATLVTGHINVGGFFKASPSQALSLVSGSAQIVEIARATVPEATAVVCRGRGFAKVVSDSGAEEFGVSGIDLAEEPRLAAMLHPLAGVLADLAQPDTILLFQSQAQRLDVKVGDAVTLVAASASGAVNTIDLRVAVIAAEQGLLSKFTVFVSNASLRALFQARPDTTGVIHLLFDETRLPPLDPLVDRLRAALTAAGYQVMEGSSQPFWARLEDIKDESWTGQRLDVTTWEDELSFMDWVLQAVNALGAIVSLFMLGIVVVGLMNTMWVAIRERTREIGTLRAIGMQRRQVFWLFLLEALLLGAIGSGLGGLLALIVAALVNATHVPIPLAGQLLLVSESFRLAVHGDAVCRSGLIITAVTGMAAVLPAARAAGLRPVVAMRHIA